VHAGDSRPVCSRDRSGGPAGRWMTAPRAALGAGGGSVIGWLAAVSPGSDHGIDLAEEVDQ
jgi:hypothetical protein